MTGFVNPLEGLLPKELVSRIWTDAALSEHEKTAALTEILDRVFKAYATQLHSDRFRGSADLMRDLTMARQGIDESSLPELVKWYLGENAEAEAFARQSIARQRQRLERTMPALCQLLGTTSTQLLLGPGQHELLIDFDRSNILFFLTDLMLLRQVHSESGLFDVIPMLVENVENRTITGRAHDFRFVDDAWCFTASSLPDNDEPQDRGEPTVFQIRERASTFQVRIAGGMEQPDLEALKDTQASGKQTAGMITAANSNDRKIIWTKPSSAWWLPALRVGQLEPGDILALTTPNIGGRVALGGRLLTMRRLDEPAV